MKTSAGILVYRVHDEPEVLLVHPGGPFFRNKDEGAWTIPKGELNEDEDPLAGAQREFTEETGVVLSGIFFELQPVKQKAGKLVLAWGVEHDIDAANIVSNEFEIEWPLRSGKRQRFAEVDKAAWFGLSAARLKINAAQCAFIDQLEQLLNKLPNVE